MADPVHGEFGDPLTAPFWRAARERRLLIQRCRRCGRAQFYPRPYCVRCQGEVAWVESPGRGVVYSLTRVHLKVLPELEPPYDVLLVELEEGPRLLGNLVEGEGECEIGDAVQVAWMARDSAPPLLQFRSASGDARA